MLREAEVTTDAVTLVWEQQESKSHYSYVVQASNGSIFLSNTVYNTTKTFMGLVAGSNYSFTVTTQTADGTQAAPVTVSDFTRMFILYIVSNMLSLHLGISNSKVNPSQWAIQPVNND